MSRLLSTFTTTELDALPIGSVFIDPGDNGVRRFAFTKTSDGAWSAEFDDRGLDGDEFLSSYGHYGYAIIDHAARDAEIAELRERVEALEEQMRGVIASRYRSGVAK